MSFLKPGSIKILYKFEQFRELCTQLIASTYNSAYVHFNYFVPKAKETER